MITFILLVLVVNVFLYAFYRWSIDRPINFPPGPPRLPIFGSYLFMMMTHFKYLHKAVHKFTEFYKSDIVGFHVGSFKVAAVHDAQAIKEILNSEDFEGRPGIFLALMRTPNFDRSGPPRIPIFGSYLFMMLSNFKYLHKGVLNFSKRYKTDIVGLYFGEFLVVVLHEPTVLKESLFNKELDGRVDSYFARIRQPNRERRGPPRIPLFGSYLFMMLANFKYLHKGVLQFSKFYKSDIVGLHMGPFPVVIVHEPEALKNMLYMESLDGRADVFLARMRHPENEKRGIFFQDGPVWKEQRRFILRFLRDYGFGRRFQELELVIQEEITDMLDLIRNGPRYEHENGICKKGGYRIQLPIFFNPFSLNSIFHVMFNERFPRAEQADVIKLLRNGLVFQRLGDDYGKMLSIIPWIRYIFPNWSSYKPLRKANMEIYEFFEKIIDRYINTYDESSERNFVDLYIKELHQSEMAVGKETTFSRLNLIMGLIDFSFPAFTAVGVQLSFLMQYFLLYPEVPKRIQAEIDEVVGEGRLPNLEDRQYLHYTEACIREILRIETLVPSDVPHRAEVDTELMGYKIPKDTVVIPSLYAYHNDKRIWGDPENFRPERFLDDDGKLCLKKDVSLPFGAGKRLCAGETFARNMMFLVTSALCQNFNFVLGPEDKLPDLSKTLNGVIITPPDFWLQLEERK